MEGDNENATNAINVAKYIIGQTPIGHLNKSIQNLKVLIGEEPMDNQMIHDKVQEYAENHLSHVQYNEEGNKLIISNLTKDTEGYYYDQGQKIKIKLNVAEGGIESIENIEDTNNLRNEIDIKVKEYLDKYYTKGITNSNVYFDSNSNYINILISAHNINIKNYWSGEWLSQWQYDILSKKLKGNIKANTYYYEEGNIQFNLNTNFNNDINGNSDNDIADNIIKLIEKNENNVQIDLESVYDNFSSQYIKPLRRKLPITGTKLNWNLNQVQFPTK
jgi:capping protein alpha